MPPKMHIGHAGRKPSSLHTNHSNYRFTYWFRFNCVRFFCFRVSRSDFILKRWAVFC